MAGWGFTPRHFWSPRMWAGGGRKASPHSEQGMTVLDVGPWGTAAVPAGPEPTIHKYLSEEGLSK